MEQDAMVWSILFSVLFFLLIIAAGPFFRWQSLAGKRRRTYQALARRFHGSYVSGGLVSRARVSFRHGECQVLVSEGACRGPYQGKGTQVILRWPEKKTVFDVFPRRDSEALAPHRRWKELASGNANFDSEFVFRSRHERTVELLTDGVCWQLKRLLHIDDDPRIYVILWGQQLIVQRPVLIRRFDDMEPFVEASLDLYDQLLLTRAEGIEFVEDAAMTLEDVICKVCGEKILQDMVYCRRCKTPHHGECWHYIGQCSVFGCLESRYLRPQPGGKPTDLHSN